MLLSPKFQTKRFGNLGEKFAQRLIKAKGYKILTTNFRSKFGEIDIIAQKNDFLVFIEVKTRWSNKYGKPEEAVTSKKLWKIKKTAEYFLLRNPSLPKKLLIEVVAIELTNGKVTSAKVISVY